MNIYGITGLKNSGKTGLTERLVAEFKTRGLTVSTIKHAHHRVAIDDPGTDSDRHRTAGASEVILSTPNGWRMMSSEAIGLNDLLSRMAPVDLVLIEGYKHAEHPKIECHRNGLGHALLAPENRSIKAIASDTVIQTTLPRFELDDTKAIADFISQELGI